MHQKIDEDEEEVEVYTSPWVSGTRAAAYFGPISAELFLPDASLEDRDKAWQWAERMLVKLLQRTAAGLGGNAVVGVEITLDPFYECADGVGLRLHAVGTCAKLEPLF